MLIALGSHGVYKVTVVSCAHVVIGICGIHMIFGRHVCVRHIHGHSMVNKSCSVCSLMWDCV